MILITGADDYIGHCVTSHLARFEPLRSSLRVLCQNTQPCLNFAKHGIEVRQTDYQNPHNLSLAMRAVDLMVIAVGYESDRVHHGKRLIEVAARSGVQSIILVSHVGALSSEHESLNHYALIEEELTNADIPSWTILRPDWIQQSFHLWTSYVERHRRFALPLPDDTEICPLDITDLCAVIENLLLDKFTKQPLPIIDDHHNGQVYTLTGPKPVNGKDMITYMRKATGYSKLQYTPTRSMDTAFYLYNLRTDIWFDARIKAENRIIYHDEFDTYAYRRYVLGAPKALQIKTYIDYFDWIHKTSSSICVSHANIINDSPTRGIQDYFQENANQFKPRV